MIQATKEPKVRENLLLEKQALLAELSSKSLGWFTLPKREAIEELEVMPPKFAQYLLYFLPKNDREPLLGDLEEEYREVYEKFGKRKAKFWYHCQVGMSFGPIIARTIRKLIGWGAIGWISNVIRKLVQ